MHKTQQLVVLAGLLIVVVMGIFPPWNYVDEGKVGRPMGYAPIWKPPIERQTETADIFGFKLKLDVQSEKANSIDFARLMAQIAIMSAVTGGAVLLLRKARA
jgi:hypothetical protein